MSWRYALGAVDPSIYERTSDLSDDDVNEIVAATNQARLSPSGRSFDVLGDGPKLGLLLWGRPFVRVELPTGLAVAIARKRIASMVDPNGYAERRPLTPRADSFDGLDVEVMQLRAPWWLRLVMACRVVFMKVQPHESILPSDLPLLSRIDCDADAKQALEATFILSGLAAFARLAETYRPAVQGRLTDFFGLEGNDVRRFER